MRNRTHKIQTYVRIPATTHTTAKKIAKKLKISFSDYFRAVLQEANTKYGKVKKVA